MKKNHITLPTKLINEIVSGLTTFGQDGTKETVDKILAFFPKNNPDPEIPKDTPDVKDLRLAGNKVRVVESRYCPSASATFSTTSYYRERGCMYAVSGLGGHQRVEITLKNGPTVVGEAWCSETAPFNRKYGRLLAISRALYGTGVNLNNL